MDPILKFDPWYLKPPEEAKEIIHSDYYIKHGEKKNIRRKIFEGVEYDEFEKKALAEFKAFLKENKVEIPPSFRESTLLKMVQAGKYNMKKSLKSMQQHVEWLNNPKWHQLDKFSTTFLEQGNVYLCGRDKKFRPCIYMDCENLNLKTQGADNVIQAICVFLKMVKAYMFLHNKVENWIFIIDTKGRGIFDLPLKALNLIIEVMQVNFGGCLEKLYILNPSYGLNATWSVIEKMIDEEAAQKIKFLKKNKLEELQQDIDPKYLQKKYSGKLEDLKQFWPPIDIYTSQEEKDERDRKLRQTAEATAEPKQAAPQTINIEGSQQRQVHQANPIQLKEISISDSNAQNKQSNEIQNSNFVKSSNENNRVEESGNSQYQQAKPAPLSMSPNNGERTNRSVNDNMKQSFGNTAFYQQTKASNTPRSKQFEIKVSHVDDIKYEYNNQNQYNKEEENAKKPSNFKSEKQKVHELINSDTQPQNSTGKDKIEQNQTKKDQAQPIDEQNKPKNNFKEIEKGFVVVQEEEEEGQVVEADNANQFLKQSKNVFSKNATIVTEDMKMVEIDQLEQNKRGGGCCSGGSTCAIF